MRVNIWFSIGLLLSVLLYNCEAAHHITKMEKHREKAEKKGAKFEKKIEYEYIVRTDTIRDTINGDILERIIYELDSIPYEVERLIYVPMNRQERKAYRDSLKYAFKTHKEDVKAYKDSLKQARKIVQSDNKKETKITRIENRKGLWLLWLGLILGAVGTFLLFRYVPFIKKLLT